jgi:hypothetical protein
MMQKSVASTSKHIDESNRDQVKYATKCIQYWFRRQRRVAKHMEKYEERKFGKKRQYKEKVIKAAKFKTESLTALTMPHGNIVNGPQLGVGLVTRDEETKSEIGLNLFFSLVTGSLAGWNFGVFQYRQM